MLDKVVNFFLVHAAIVLPVTVALTLVVSSTARSAVKLLLRLAARLLLIAAVVAIAYDVSRTLAGGTTLVITSLGDHWTSLHPASIEAFRKLIGTKAHPLLWDSALRPVLRLPAWLVLGVLAFLLGWLGRRRRKVSIFVN
jgi:hypothetical protein